MDDLNQSKVQYIIIIMLLQSFLLLFVTIWRGTGLISIAFENLLHIILFIAVGLSILSIIMVKELSKTIKHETAFKIQQIKLKENKKLIKSLRSQKHDFSNHLQTIYGMVQLDKKEQIKDYINSLNQELVKLKFSQPDAPDSILDSILLPKKEKALKLGIEFDYQIDKGISSIKVPINKLFRIVSNLVDNAIDASKTYEDECRIKVEGKDREENYSLSVYNTGPIIKEELIDKIFQPGFSTKGDDRGFGLYIIKSLVEEFGGELEVKSEKGFGTEFSCSFNKEL